MESRKRKLPQPGLQRRVRARAEPEPDLDGGVETSDSAPSEEEVEGNGSESASDSDSESSEGSDEDGSSGEDEDEEQGASVDASKISFGTLAKAQAKLGQSGRRKKKGEQPDDEEAAAAAEEEDEGPKPRGQGPKKEKPPSRSSKHAPQEVSSKRPVSRKREIIPVKKVQYRDPRFDPAVTGRSVKTKADEDHVRRAYAFLDEYREDELRKLKGAVKKAITPAEKEQLQRAYMSMESRKKARDKKDKERAVVEEHRRREKELVKQGVKSRPFYLKKSEQKKQLLTDQFSSLSEKQREKAIEKKRKKIAGKEKKAMPMERRARE